MIVLDAGVLIAHIDPNDAHHDATRSFLEEFEEFDFAANVISISESLVYPTRAGKGPELMHAFRRLHIIQLEIGIEVALGLAETRASSGLRMPDAVVLHSAEHHDAQLATTDRRLFAAAEARGVTAHLVGSA